MIWAVLLVIGVQASALLASRRECRALRERVDGLAKENKQLHYELTGVSVKRLYRNLGSVISVMTETYRVGGQIEISDPELRAAAGPSIDVLNYYIRGLQAAERENIELKRAEMRRLMNGENR